MPCSLGKREQARTIILYKSVQRDPFYNECVLFSTLPFTNTTDLLHLAVRHSSRVYVPGNVKKCASKKMKPLERPVRNLQDVPPHASVEDVKQRKVFDLRRW